MFVDFYGSSLEHDESVFIPTTITKFGTQDSSRRKKSPRPWVWDKFTCYILRKEWWILLTAACLDRHVEYTKWNAMRNDVELRDTK
ncbi:MAG: hypothetical protein CM15mP106_7200 [Candidatus Neomarinimicrobiota bacterium]|nr:MAG: hypothetical protein CM15mP106_7200 [Candidatus Neomarinimicrobiota bacterium]